MALRSGIKENISAAKTKDKTGALRKMSKKALMSAFILKDFNYGIYDIDIRFIFQKILTAIIPYYLDNLLRSLV